MGDDPESEEDVGRPRASIRPSPGRGMWRVAFSLAWVTAQIGLILTADRRPDGAFGFRMFSESTTMRVALYREVVRPDGQRDRVKVPGGAWDARDAAGVMHHFSWGERVKKPDLAIFDAEIHASYGARAELTRLQAALDDVATHVPDDVETRRLQLEVTIRQNGREGQVTRLASAERRGGS